jgi:hypothetical protein
MGWSSWQLVPYQRIFIGCCLCDWCSVMTVAKSFWWRLHMLLHTCMVFITSMTTVFVVHSAGARRLRMDGFYWMHHSVYQVVTLLFFKYFGSNFAALLSLGLRWTSPTTWCFPGICIYLYILPYILTHLADDQNYCWNPVPRWFHLTDSLLELPVWVCWVTKVHL